jgi:hypothetical protein
VTGEQQEAPVVSLTPGMLLAKQAMVHLLVWLLAFSQFAAADSWFALTGWAVADFLAVITAVAAGFVTTTLAHEWSHYLGARLCGASYRIHDKVGLFVFDWDFSANTVRQFNIMSVAGSVGGALGVALLLSWVQPDTAGRAALVAGGIASFAFAAVIEWPVLARTRRSGDPLAELSRTDQRVLLRSLLVAVVAGMASWWLISG